MRALERQVLERAKTILGSKAARLGKSDILDYRVAAEAVANVLKETRATRHYEPPGGYFGPGAIPFIF